MYLEEKPSYEELRQRAEELERKRAEEDLRESQRQLSTLMGNLPRMAYRCLNVPDWM